MQVIKFGGSSISDAARIRAVSEIIKNGNYEHDVAVFSAFGGATDQLLKMASGAAAGEDYTEDLERLIERHLSIASDLIPDDKDVSDQINKSFSELRDLLHGVFLIREASPRTMDHILSFGERASAFIISRYFDNQSLKAVYCDARKLLRTNDKFGSARVRIRESEALVLEFAEQNQDRLKVVTGFIGSNEEGATTTLGRGGSDYTASVFAAILEATNLEIWTDVDGVLTANPARVKNAYTIPQLSYHEAMELSHFGAKVIYPPTIQPALSKSIPIRIRNTFNPEFEGTLITTEGIAGKEARITGLSSIPDVTLLTLEGAGLMGIPGTAARLFGTLGRELINVIMITQASSEHSICLAVESGEAEKARRAIEAEFRNELEHNQIDPIGEEDGLCLIAIVGERMRAVPGVSGRLFNALGQNGINVVAIAQGSSERNITFAIANKNESKALNVLHDSFFLSQNKKVHVLLMGVGLIGSALLEQIKKQQELLKTEKHLDVRVVAIANSRKMYFEEEGIDLNNWKKDLEERGVNSGFTNFLDKALELNLPNSLFVDCTANPEVKNYYSKFLNHSISISTANKVAASSGQDAFEMLNKTALEKNVEFMFETNVGAGLPILSTLKNQVDSGDTVHRILAVVSGSLSWIFNNYTPEKKFSELVGEARKLGYTEPDPREDLSGQDIKRKIIILARVAGFRIEPADVDVEPILPESCMQAKTVDDFFIQLDKEDDFFRNIVNDATESGTRLRYLAVYENGKANIRLEKVDSTSPFFNLASTDNMVVLYTDRYRERPLIVQGPGAGADVTAAGVFAEIIQRGVKA